jgi:hypothetical protein
MTPHKLLGEWLAPVEGPKKLLQLRVHDHPVRHVAPHEQVMVAALLFDIRRKQDERSPQQSGPKQHALNLLGS